MKKKIISGFFILTVATVISSGVWAKNNGQGGGMRSDHPKGQMSRDSGRDSKHRTESTNNIREPRDDDDVKARREERQERKEESYRENRSGDDVSPGLNKRGQKKATQEQKELGRGSEKGQQSREEHSRKWWKFW